MDVQMDTQNIIVFLIVAAAGLYVGSLVWKKLKALGGKAACARNCGCEAVQPAAKNNLLNIQKATTKKNLVYPPTK